MRQLPGSLPLSHNLILRYSGKGHNDYGHPRFFLKNNDKKSKNKNKNKNKFNDYTSFLNPEIVQADPQGMYTGVPADMYYNDELDMPVQDADDL